MTKTEATERARALLQQMTLDEKLAQLGAVWAHKVIDGEVFSAEKAAPHLVHGTGHITRIGSTTLFGPRQNAEIINGIQSYLRDHTRLGIPAIIHEESCAGFTARDATQFPQALGLAGTFEPELAQRMGEVIRTQMRAVGATQTLAPVLDVMRDARWGRCEETFGEDPYLVSRMGVAYVRGVQGADLSTGVAATGKHFAGYGMSEAGHNWGPSFITRREFLERVVPPFEAAIREAGLASVMNGYQEIDGVPCGASKQLLTDLLRGELGFDGTVVADYYTVLCLMAYHRIAADKATAAARALNAGIDVELPSLDCYRDLTEAMEQGQVTADAIDTAVLRVLTTKAELGLLDRSTVDATIAADVFDTPSQRALARHAAVKTMTLLQNRDSVLPLSPSLKRIAVIGPNADSKRHLQGDYHYPTHLEVVYGPIPDPGFAFRPSDTSAAPLLPGAPAEGVDLSGYFTPHVTVLEGIRAAVSADTVVEFALGCDLRELSTDGFAQAIDVATRADVAIVVVGGRSGLPEGNTTGEGNDAADVTLTGAQAELVRRVAATGTKTVVVLVNGRPLALTNIVDPADAILEAWLPGEEGGNAIADVLFGKESPAGRLPVTLPRHSGQLPLYYNRKPSGGRSQFYGGYSDMPETPLFAFGHGLSYSRFEYGALELSSQTPDATDSLSIHVNVTNVGAREADEVIQLYVQDFVGSVTRPVQELKGFVRASFAPGQSRRVKFDLDLKQLAFYDDAMAYVVEPGWTEIMVGASSLDIRQRVTIETTGPKRVLERALPRPTVVTVE